VPPMITTRSIIRSALPLALLLAMLSPVQALAGEACTENFSDMANMVKANGLMPAKELQRQAGDKIDGKIVKVSLCQTGGAYQYELVFLNGNGQLVTQAVDAKTPFPQ
jgi:uncharacterized membrane protein YkoI